MARENLTQKRKDDIVNACEKLYNEKSFRDINVKEIGEITSFTRTTIYNYFINKEEILLELFKREYSRWNTDLTTILLSEKLTREQFAHLVAQSLEDRTTLLHILSTNFVDFDELSRYENIVSFKKTYGMTLKIFREMLKKFFYYNNEEKVNEFLMIFFPFLSGVYPYTTVSKKQEDAMREADVPYIYLTQKQIIENCILNLLKSED